MQTFEETQTYSAPPGPPPPQGQNWSSQPQPRPPKGGSKLPIIIAFLVAVVAIVIAFLAFASKSKEQPTQAQTPAQVQSPAQSPAPAQSASAAPQSQATSSPAPATAPPAEEVETVPTSSGDVVIENATVDANGTVTVNGYAVETGVSPEDVEAVITYADEVISTLPTTINGQNFNFNWSPKDLGSRGNIRDLASSGSLSELGKYQVRVKDKRHPDAPASVGFRQRTPGQAGRPGADSPSLPGGSAPSRPGGRR